MPPKIPLTRVKKAYQRDAQLWADILYSIIASLREEGWHYDPTPVQLTALQFNIIATMLSHGAQDTREGYYVDDEQLNNEYNSLSQVIEDDEQKEEEQQKQEPQEERVSSRLQTPMDESTPLLGEKEEVTE